MSDEETWTELWPEGTDSIEWSHSGIAVDSDGRVYFAAPEGGALISLDASGESARRIPVTLLEIHGITDDPFSPGTLWLADPGEKPRSSRGYTTEVQPGRAVALTAEGERDLEQPSIASYAQAPWRPTSIAVDREGVWVADGYGASLVHRFDRAGRHLFALDGGESGERFECPHGVVVTGTGAAARLTVADRGNRRLVRYALGGELAEVVTDPQFVAPSSLAVRGEELVVTELYGGLLAVTADGRVRSLIEQRAQRIRVEPWPNARVGDRLVRPALTHGVLNSPHGVAVDAAGRILLTEWLIGGRQWRLQLAAANR